MGKGQTCYAVAAGETRNCQSAMIHLDVMIKSASCVLAIGEVGNDEELYSILLLCMSTISLRIGCGCIRFLAAI